jgi:hypothetical protein
MLGGGCTTHDRTPANKSPALVNATRDSKLFSHVGTHGCCQPQLRQLCTCLHTFHSRTRRRRPDIDHEHLPLDQFGHTRRRCRRRLFRRRSGHHCRRSTCTCTRTGIHLVLLGQSQHVTQQVNLFNTKRQYTHSSDHSTYYRLDDLSENIRAARASILFAVCYLLTGLLEQLIIDLRGGERGKWASHLQTREAHVPPYLNVKTSEYVG